MIKERMSLSRPGRKSKAQQRKDKEKQRESWGPFEDRLSWNSYKENDARLAME